MIPGLCSVPDREKIPPALHVPEKESEEEDDGVYEFLHGCEVLP